MVKDSWRSVMFIYVYCRADDQLSAVQVVPVVGLPDVFELSYYANALLPIFAAESVLGENNSQLGGVTVRMLDLRSQGRGFDSSG